MKKISTREYVAALRTLTEEGRSVTMTVSGSSMAPFLIHGRDAVCFEKPRRALQRGDVVFFQRRDGRFVLHRICRCAPEGYYIVGDGQREIEGPVAPGQIFALVTRARRKGRWLGPGSFWWEFFRRPWLTLLPLRPLLIRLYAGLHPSFRRGRDPAAT